MAMTATLAERMGEVEAGRGETTGVTQDVAPLAPPQPGPPSQAGCRPLCQSVFMGRGMQQGRWRKPAGENPEADTRS